MSSQTRGILLTSVNLFTIRILSLVNSHSSVAAPDHAPRMRRYSHEHGKINIKTNGIKSHRTTLVTSSYHLMLFNKKMGSKLIINDIDHLLSDAVRLVDRFLTCDSDHREFIARNSSAQIIMSKKHNAIHMSKY